MLGCYNGPNSEITLLQGWNWYAGADPSQIGAGQYDFETTVTHELGHALGLGHSADPELADVRDPGDGRGRPDRDHARSEHPRPARRGRPSDRGRVSVAPKAGRFPWRSRYGRRHGWSADARVWCDTAAAGS